MTEPSNKHTSRCTICNHPNRENIEEDYSEWLSAGEIADKYEGVTQQAVRRHFAAVKVERSTLGLIETQIEKMLAMKKPSPALKDLIRLRAELRGELKKDSKEDTGKSSLDSLLDGMDDEKTRRVLKEQFGYDPEAGVGTSTKVETGGEGPLGVPD